MSEISDFENSLNPGLSFETHIARLTWQLAELIDEQDAGKFLGQWNAWVLDLPQTLDLALLQDVQFKYLRRADAPANVLPDYSYIVESCGIYAAAAQRAHKRSDSRTAWDLLIAARRLLNEVEGIENELGRLKQKAAKSARTHANGDIPGQRVRYQIIALLHRNRAHQKPPMLFKSVKLAVEKIDDDIARFIEDNELQISHVKLVSTVKMWIRDHPAFRAEIAPFFMEGVIEN